MWRERSTAGNLPRPAESRESHEGRRLRDPDEISGLFLLHSVLPLRTPRPPRYKRKARICDGLSAFAPFDFNAEEGRTRRKEGR